MKKLLCLLVLTASCFGTTTVTGHISTLGTGSVTSGALVRFYLRGCGRNQPRITGTGAIAPQVSNGNFYFDIAADGSGNVSGTLYSTRDAVGTGNGQIECGGSYTAVWYGMVVINFGVAGPEVPITAKSGATIDISNVTPNSTQPVSVAPTGDNTYLQLTGGNSPVTGLVDFSGGLNTKTLNSIRFADQFANVEAAGADCGVNKCIVVIPSTYAGTDCATTLRANVTYVDYRGSELCLNNATTYNYTTVGNTHTMIRHQMRVTGVLPSGGGTASLYPITEAYNVTGDGTQTLDGSAQETQITGTLTGSIGNATGAEVDTYILSNGGTVNLATGIQAYVLSGTGTTTAVSEVRAVDALGYTGTGASPSRVYSLYGRLNTGGSSRNYSLGIEGLGLLKYANNGYAASGLDCEDSSNVTHRCIYVASDNTTNVQAVTRYLNLNGSDNITQLQIDGTANGVSVPGTLGVTGVTTATGGLKIGASGSTISDTRELVQSSHACGSTSTCANTANQSAREIWGTITLSTGAATLTGITAYTSTSSFVCMCTDQTSAAACKAVPASTTSVTFAGTGSDVLAYRCVGN